VRTAAPALTTGSAATVTPIPISARSAAVDRVSRQRMT
jgi:hypothetical protein